MKANLPNAVVTDSVDDMNLSQPSSDADLFAKILNAWVAWVTNHARMVLIFLGILFCLSLFVVFNFAKINSDLNSLIKPSEALSWHRNNEEYKRVFPMSDQTAFVVVNGPDYGRVKLITKQLSFNLVRSGHFEFVFVPGLSDYLEERKLYFLDLKNLQAWISGVEYNYGALLRLADDASVANGINIYSDIISSNQRLPVPRSILSLVEGLSVEIDLEGFPPLYDSDKETHYQLIIVKGRQNLDERLPNKEIIDNLNDIVGNVAPADDVQIRISGELALANDEISAGLSGVAIAGTISLILLAFILGFGVRSLRLIMSIFLLLLVGVIFTMALATFTVGSFNTLSFIFVVMFFGLGVDFAVHFLLRMTEAQKESGSPSIVAIKDIGPALGLCVVTSMIAFLSFVPTAYSGLGELGIISAGGMVIAFLLTISLLPALHDHDERETRPWTSVPLLFDVQRHAIKIVIVTFVLSSIAFYFAKNMTFDYSVLAMRDAETEAMEALLDLQEEKLITDYSIAVLADNGKQARDLKREFLKLDVVGDVVIPMDFIPENQVEKQSAMLGTKGIYEDIDEILPSSTNLSEAIIYLKLMQDSIPKENRDAASVVLESILTLEHQTELLAELDNQVEDQLRSELQQLLVLLDAKPFKLEDIPEEYRSRLITADGKHLIMIQPVSPLLNREASEDFINAVRKIAPNYAGRSVVEWGVGEVVVESFFQAGSLTLILVSILLLFYFKSVVLSILVLVPIFLSLLFTFAICDMIGVNLNMANVLVVPLIIGLGVDTGIHVVHRYHSEIGSRSLVGSQESVRNVYRSSTLSAVLISGLTTIGTFFSLSFSPHKGAASIGMLLTIAISLLLMATFIVLPALLSILNARGNRVNRIIR